MADTEAGLRSGRWRRLLSPVTTVLAVVALWSVLVAPDRLFRLTPAAFLRIPLEALVLVGLTLLLPPRRVRSVAAALGAVIGLLAVVRVLDLGFQEVLHRPFNPVNDWRLVGPAVDMVGESFGEGWARAAVVGVVLVLIALSAALTLAVIRVCGVAARRRRVTARTVGSLGVVWLVCVVLGVQLTPGVPVASRETAELAVVHVRDAARDLGDVSVFRAQVTAEDPWRTVPAEELLTGLRGKDVLIVFVESYGRVAVQGSSFSPDIRDLLAAGTDRLRAAGFSARSGFLTSPTFAGLSWLAHATLHSGLWIGTQQRHDRLLESDRFTLAGAFGRAGWRTVVEVPSNRDPWDEGRAFYGFDADHDRHDVGYEGPKFGFAAVPDQYTLSAFERMELGPGHAPVMAEIDLVSSHEPWTPLPRMLDWGELGDGSAYRGMPAEGPAPAAVLGDTDRIRALYAESIRYSLTAVISFVTTLHEEDDDLVVLLVGDHQPASIITGPDASHDVPITMIAGDPAVLDHITSWGWDDGMLPGPNAPLWRMDAFRDRFLTAFSAAPIPAPAQVLSE